MSSNRWHPSQCRHCGRTVGETGYITATGKCTDCADERKAANLEQLVYHRGPWFDHWRKRCLAALGVAEVRDGA